ncbi:hypothetical protein AB0467_29100 [Streptomyces sp. NPDC052095]|uniref:hypothetical protein n=1 Tax=unclassified Streptomyces TaxID=2593676 RepID=UPI00345039D6
MDAEGHVMADERYEWLDKETAERLLRGEPVDPVEGPSGRDADAERLAAALEAAARTARPATTELPGEAAALAAFRERPRTARARGAADGTGVRSGTLAPVRIGPAPAAGPGRARWSRPVRLGLVASFAGCALGGVAVAAGTGILPVPFGGSAQPASSVSAAATPEGLAPDPAGEPPAKPSASPDTGTTTPPASPSAPGHASGGPDRSKDRGNGRGGEKDDGSGRTPGSVDSGRTGRPGGSGTNGWYAKALQACRDYRDGKLGEQRRHQLEELAKGAAKLDRFCDRLLGESGDEQDDNKGGGSGSGNSGGSGNNGNGNNGDGNNGPGSGRGDDQGDDENGGWNSGIGYTASPTPSGAPGDATASGSPVPSGAVDTRSARGV